MSFFAKIYAILFFGTLELNFLLLFCDVSTIIRYVDRNPFMILFAPLCIIYLYSPQKATSFPLVAFYVVINSIQSR